MGGFNPTSFTAGSTAQDYMSPYLQASLEPQLAEAQRQAQIQQMQNASRLGKAGAFGGSRQAIMDSEAQRNLLRNMADITGQGYQQAYTQGLGQFNIEQDRAQQAQDLTNRYGLSALGMHSKTAGWRTTRHRAARHCRRPCTVPRGAGLSVQASTISAVSTSGTTY